MSEKIVQLNEEVIKRVRRDHIESAIMPGHLFLLRRVIIILERDLGFCGNGILNGVHDPHDSPIGGLEALINVELPLDDIGILGTDKSRKLLDKCFTLLLANKP